MKNKVVVFDLDDTLCKEIDFLQSAYREIARRAEEKFGLSGVYSFMLENYRAKKDVFSALIETFRLPLEKSDLLAAYRAHKPAIRLCADAENALARLKQNAVLGIITDGRSRTQRNKFDALNLRRFIDEENLLISEEFGSEKPCERNYLYFEKRYENADFAYVGDNPRKDFLAPNRLGWKTFCLLDDGRNIHPQNFDFAKEYLPQAKIRTLSELPE